LNKGAQERKRKLRKKGSLFHVESGFSKDGETRRIETFAYARERNENSLVDSKKSRSGETNPSHRGKGVSEEEKP